MGIVDCSLPSLPTHAIVCVRVTTIVCGDVCVCVNVGACLCRRVYASDQWKLTTVERCV